MAIQPPPARIEPGAPVVEPPGPPPHPILEQAGFMGTIADFNAQVQHVIDQHTGQYGYHPPAARTLQAVTAAGPKGVPPATAPASVQKAIQDAQKAGPQTSYLQDLSVAAKQGRAEKYLTEHPQEFETLPVRQKIAVGKIIGAEQDDKRKHPDASQVILPPAINPWSGETVKLSKEDATYAGFLKDSLKNGQITRAEAIREWAMWQAETSKTPYEHSNLGTSLFTTPTGQVVESLIHAPGGIYQLGKAATLDLRDQLIHPLREPKGRTAGIAVQMGKQIVEDVTHPYERPGFLFLDALGLFGAGSGAVARAGAAGRVLREGGDLGDAAQAAARRPVGGTAPLTALRTDETPGITVQVPLSDNPSRAFIQKARVARKQTILDAHAKGETAGVMSALLPDAIYSKLSPEAFIRKRLTVADHIQQTVDLAVARDLKVATGWARRGDTVLSRVPQHFWRGLTVGEQKGIFASALDDPTPVQTMLEQHQKWIEEGYGNAQQAGTAKAMEGAKDTANAHERHIDALYLAADALKANGYGDLVGDITFPEGWKHTAKPSTRFQKAMALAREASDQQEAIKARDLGLTPEVAEDAIAASGQIFRTGRRESDPRVVNEKIRKATTEANQQEAQITAAAPVEPRVLPVRNDPVSNYSSPAVPLEELHRLMPEDGAHLYHSTTPENLARIRAEGLKPGKNRPGETTGVYFAQDGIDVFSLRPGSKRSGDVLLRVNRTALNVEKTDMFAPGTGTDEWVSRGPVHQNDIEYLGSDNQWHPLSVPAASPSGPTILWPDLETKISGIRAGLENTIQDLQNPPKLKKVREESFYVGARIPKDARGRMIGRAQLRPSQYGVPMPSLARDVPELQHTLTGDLFKMGAFSMDTTGTIIDNVARAVRGASRITEWRRLYTNGAREIPRGKLDEYQAVRGAQGVPDELKEIFQREESALTAEDVGKIGDDSELLRYLYPPADEAIHLDDVRWVHKDLIPPGNREIISTGLQHGLQLLNLPARFAYFFTRPAYALNLLGNVPMALMHQGGMTPINVMRAFKAKELYGERNAATMRALLGQGKNISYVDERYSTRFERNVAHAWGRINDEALRTSALIDEMTKRGYRTKEQVTEFLNSKNPSVVADRDVSVEKARKAMVDFEHLSPIEAQLIKHVIFVYPWMSRSFLWSLNTVLDHPLQVDFLAHLGEQEAENDPIFQNAPDWFKKIGYFSYGWTNDGKPKILNPTSVWSFATLGDVHNLVGAAVGSGSNFTSLSDMFGPWGQLATHAATGRDSYGQMYKGSQFWAAVKDVLVGIPQIAAYQRQSKAKTADIPPVDITDRETLIKRVNAALKETVLTPGWLDGYGALIAGGFAPRGVNLDALAARQWRDATPAQKHAWQTSLINKALNIQAEALGQPVPPQVRRAVNTTTDLAYKIDRYLHDENPVASQRDITVFAIKTLTDSKVITPAEAVKYTAALKNLVDQGDYRSFRAMMVDKATGGNLTAWDQDVRSLALYTNRATLQGHTDFLARQGLSPKMTVSGSDEQLREAGRELVKYKHEARALSRRIAADTTSDEDRIRLRAQLAALDDQYDKPILHDGKPVAPSVVRAAWSDMPLDAQVQHRDSLYSRKWGDLSNFDKELTGRKTPRVVADGWAVYHQVVAEYKAQKGPGEKNLDRDQLVAIATQIDKGGYQGFLTDWRFANKPLAERVGALRIVKDSAFPDYWQDILGKATKVVDAIKSGAATREAARQAWDTWANREYAALKDGEPRFYAELQRYPRIIYRLIGT
jgi:hypothetical protein